MSREPPYGWVPGKERYRPIRTLFECALYKSYLRVTCWQCRYSVILDAPGHWWRCEQKGLSDSIAAFVRRLHCSQCFKRSGIKVREPKVAQTSDEPKRPLMPERTTTHVGGSSTGNNFDNARSECPLLGNLHRKRTDRTRPDCGHSAISSASPEADQWFARTTM